MSQSLYTLTPSRTPTKAPAKAAPVWRPMSAGNRTILKIAAVLVFTIGIPLYLMPDRTETAFAWTINSTLTAAFLGASYWAAGVLEWLGSQRRTWAYGRIAIPAVLLFTFLTLVVTLLHIDRFHFDSPNWWTVAGTWAWLLVYAGVPVAMTVLLVLQLRMPGGDPPRTTAIPLWGQIFLWTYALLLIPMGVAFLVGEATVANRLWPWALTPLTARAIGAWLFSLGISAAHALWERDWLRILPAMRSILVLGLLQIAALIRYPAEVQWSGLAAWLYVGILASMVALGSYAWWGTPLAPGDTGEPT